MPETTREETSYRPTMTIGGVLSRRTKDRKWQAKCPQCKKTVHGSAFKLQQHFRWCL